MNPFDDRLSDLLQNDDVDAGAPAPDVGAAMTGFRRRRQRRLAVAGGALSLAFVVAGAGLLAVARDDDANRLVPAMPPPTAEPDPTVPVTTLPDESADPTSVGTTLPDESADPTVPVTTVPDESADPTSVEASGPDDTAETTAPSSSVDSSPSATTTPAQDPSVATDGLFLVPFAELPGLDQPRNDAFVDHAIVHDGVGWTFYDENGTNSGYLASCPSSSTTCSGSIQATTAHVKSPIVAWIDPEHVVDELGHEARYPLLVPFSS